MDRIKKYLKVMICISIISLPIFIYNIWSCNFEINYIKHLIGQKLYMYSYCLDCKSKGYEIKDGEIIYDVKIGSNTTAIVEYLNSKGYDISIQENGNKASELVDFLKEYRRRNNIEGEYERDSIKDEMTESGYEWLH